MITAIWRAGRRFAAMLDTLSDQGETIANEIRSARESRQLEGVAIAQSEPPKLVAETTTTSRRKASA